MTMRKQICLTFCLLIAVAFLIGPVLAQSDEECLACHTDPDVVSGERSLFVDQEKFASSVHGMAGFSCVDCHADLAGFEDYPHEEDLRDVRCSECHGREAEDFSKSIHSQANPIDYCCFVKCSDCHGHHDILPKESYESRIFPLNLPQTCEKCHLERVKTERGSEFIKKYEQSIHYQGLEKSGLATSSNCSNCHGAHDVRMVHDPDSRVSRKNIIRTCGKCHVGIERDYLEGVHGKDYVKGLKDVPVCTDCHSEHDIHSPRELSSNVYATKVAAICTRCHDDEALAREYGFLTSRLKSFSGSFHGKASRFGETRVANCASCHGFHDIRPSTDPKSKIHPNNLPNTCGDCHSGAGPNFTKGLIHVVSEKTTNKWAYYVKTFYIIIIVGCVGIFLIFISADLFHRLLHKGKTA